MKKILTACLLPIILCGAASAVTLWSEDFESYISGTGIDGTGNIGSYPSGVSKWTLYQTGFDNGTPFDYIKVEMDDGTKKLEAQDSHTECGWESEAINIAGFSEIAVLMDLNEDGNANPTDILDMEYKVDSGDWTAFSVNGQLSDDFTSAVATQTGLAGTTLYLRWRVTCESSTEQYQLDNVIVTGNIVGNRVPVLAGIGDQTVLVNNELRFAVSATDENTGDNIVLSATNLPGGAIFNAVTNSGGSVSNTFIWTDAAPTGTYTVTFFADDGTTNDSETITITVSEPAALAQSITFDFRNDANLYGALDNQSGPIAYINNGLTATFTAIGGTMNHSANGFGIDAGFFDEADKFDFDESIDITFEAKVTLTNITVSSWNTGTDEAVVYVNGVSSGVITSTGSHPLNITIPSNEVLRISCTQGFASNGFSLDSIAVTISSSQPEIPSLALITGDTQPTLNWTAASKHRYTVLWASSLTNDFQPLATIDSPTNSWTDTNHTADVIGFYKLEAQEIP